MENQQPKPKVHIFLSSEEGLLKDNDRNILSRTQDVSFGVLRALLNMHDYGEGIKGIFFIQVLASDEEIKNLGWKEVRLYDKAKQEVEIRLHCDWQKFTNGSDEEKELVVFNSIVASIAAMKEVAPETFDAGRLVSDFKKASVGLF